MVLRRKRPHGVPPLGEKGGRIYLKLGIRKWKDHLPDMSCLMPDMVRKDLGSDPAVLVQETCVPSASTGR